MNQTKGANLSERKQPRLRTHVDFNDITAGHTNTPKATEAMRNVISAHVAAMKER